MRKRARSAVDREQVIHERHDALKARVGRLGFGLHLNGIDEAAPGVRKAAGVDQIFGSDIFFIHDVSIGVEDSTASSSRVAATGGTSATGRQHGW